MTVLCVGSVDIDFFIHSTLYAVLTTRGIEEIRHRNIFI